MTFDISEYELADTGTLIVQNKKGDDDLLVDGKQVKIVLYSAGAEQSVKAEHKIVNLQTKRTFAAIRGGKQVGDSAETAMKELAEKLATRTKSIENFPITDPLTLYSNPKLIYIRKQVEKYLDDDSNF